MSPQPQQGEGQVENVIVFDQVSKSYQNFRLDRVSFTAKREFIHGFIGRNGAGKTTTVS